MRRGVKHVTEANIKAYARKFNVLKTNHLNLVHQSGDKKYRENNIPDHRENINLLIDFFDTKFGSSKAQVIRATQHSAMAGGKLVPEDVSWRQMVGSRPGLRKYIKDCLETGELYNDPSDFEELHEDDDLVVSDDDSGDDDDDGGDDNDDPDGILPEDTVEVQAAKKAASWLKKNKPSRIRGETEDDYVSRVKVLYQDGIHARAQRRTRAAVVEDEVDVDPDDEVEDRVGAGARSYFETLMGAKEEKPYKILEHKDQRQGRFFKVLWHDVGYAGQDRVKWVPRDYVLKFPGLLENYQAVCDPKPSPQS